MRRRFPPFVKKAIENCSDKPGILLMITHRGILTAMLPFVFENLDSNFVQACSIEHLSIIKGELKHGRLALCGIHWESDFRREDPGDY
jgi:hypothetical protein